MIFLGRTFCSARNTLDCTSTNVKDITSMKLQNGIFDEAYISRNADRTYTITIPSTWDFKTLLHATFVNNLNAGNVDFILSQVSAVRVKRRIKGTYDWITLYEIPISVIEDLNFERFDKYCQSTLEYEYSIVPIIDNAEGTSTVNSIKSEFDGIFFIEKYQTFSTILDINIQTQKNKPSAIVNTLDRKYPYVVNNSQNNYYTGTISATFIEQSEDCELKIDEGWQYRQEFMNFLQDGKPKIIKNEDGKIWLATIIDNPSEQPDGHPQKVTTSINFVEIGDATSKEDLYDNNFIDLDL